MLVDVCQCRCLLLIICMLIAFRDTFLVVYLVNKESEVPKFTGLLPLNMQSASHVPYTYTAWRTRETRARRV